MPLRKPATWLLSGIGLLTAVAGCGSTTDDRPATWAYIAPAIIEPSCATASCHSDIAQRAGVDLYEPDVAYNALINRHFVIPSAPDTSELMALIKAEGSRRMPPDFPLPADDIALIQKWIADGAKQ